MLRIVITIGFNCSYWWLLTTDFIGLYWLAVVAIVSLVVRGLGCDLCAVWSSGLVVWSCLLFSFWRVPVCDWLVTVACLGCGYCCVVLLGLPTNFVWML